MYDTVTRLAGGRERLSLQRRELFSEVMGIVLLCVWALHVRTDREQFVRREDILGIRLCWDPEEMPESLLEVLQPEAEDNLVSGMTRSRFAKHLNMGLGAELFVIIDPVSATELLGFIRERYPTEVAWIERCAKGRKEGARIAQAA